MWAVWEQEDGRGGDKETGREGPGLLGERSSPASVLRGHREGGGDRLAVKGFLCHDNSVRKAVVPQGAFSVDRRPA